MSASPSDPIRICIGFDPRETVAYHVLVQSLLAHASRPLAITPVMLAQLGAVFTRPRDPLQSTDFAFARFLTPWLGAYAGWSLFMDCDMLAEADIAELWALRDPRFAVQVVKLAWCGDADGAEAALAHCLAAQPQHALAHQRRAYLLLARGDYANGWREHLWRIVASTGEAYLRDPRLPDRLLPSPLTWGAGPLGGRRLLVLAEEGLGDELFCLRFVAALRARGAHVIYQPSPKLYPLLQGTPLLDGVVAPAAALPEFDYALAMGELGLLAMLQGAAPLPPPFALALAAEPSAAGRARLAAAADGPYLGLTWRAGRAADGVRRKAVPLAALAAALRAWPGSLVALQRDADADELATLAQASGCPVMDCRDEADSLSTALPLLAALDDYVGVSNTLVHVLTSLGRPGRVLLPLAAEWRWQQKGARSPWMPGITLYRAGATRDWRVALAHLTRELAHAAGPRS